MGQILRMSGKKDAGQVKVKFLKINTKKDKLQIYIYIILR